MDYNEFATKIKAKYPDYADMDNRDLAQRMVAKFPEYSDVTFDEPYQPSGLEQAAEISSGIQDAVIGPVDKASDYVSRKASNLMFGSEKPAELVQKGIGAVAGGIERAGEYVAEKGGELGYPKIGSVAGMVVANTPYFALPVGKAAGPLPGTATMARRTLFNKQNILKKVGGVEAAEKSGVEMLNQGVIGPFASKETMLARAEALGERVGTPIRQIPNAMDSIAVRGVNAETIASEIEKQLAPKLKKGAFSRDVNNLKEIIDTVKAAGRESTYADAQTIKEKLQSMGNFPKGQIVDDASREKIMMARRASGIFNRSMEKQLNAESPKLGSVYSKAKEAYGPIANAKRGLSDAYITESANVVPSLRGTISGAEALGRGDWGRAAMLLGAYDFLNRKGAQLGAYSLGKAIPATVGSVQTRRALLSQLVDRLTTKEGTQYGASQR